MSSHVLGICLTDHSNHLPILRVEPEAPQLQLENIYLNDQQQPADSGVSTGSGDVLHYHSLELSRRSSMTVAW